jgi:hypothetical protein
MIAAIYARKGERAALPRAEVIMIRTWGAHERMAVRRA